MPESATPTPAAPAGDPPAPKVETKNEPKPDPKPSEPKAKPDEPLGENGLKALQAERDARKELEKQLEQLKPLAKIAEALGGGDADKGKSEIEQLTERLGKHEELIAEERSARWRAEVAHELGFTVEQASELRGKTREEIAAHANRLKELFPSQPATPGTPKPDPSQGSRGPVGVDARIAEAEEKGDAATAIRLKSQQLLK